MMTEWLTAVQAALEGVLVPLSHFGTVVRWFVLGVGIAFAYYVVYSLHRLRRNLHHVANSLTVVLGERELERHRDHPVVAGPRRPAARR
jgi:hypothetical protein